MQRRREYLDRFLATVDADAAFVDILRVLHDAMRNAEISARVQVPDDPGHFTYGTMPDHAVRITAARVFAELLGLVGSKDILSVNVAGDVVQVSVNDRVTELASVGVPLEVLVRELRQVADDAAAALPSQASTVEPPPVR